jgi:hypothetical protein
MDRTILRHTVLGAVAVTAAVGAAFAVLAEPVEAPAAERRLQSLEAGDGYLLKPIARYRRETWHWQQLMGRKRTPTSNTARQSRDPQYRRWVLALWRHRAERMRRLAMKPPNRRAWRCIQRYEGPWSDPRAPYYGGLQMDLHFQRLYGGHLLRRKGTADRWTPIEQMWVAEKALRAGRGFHPWPNTARFCGLL